MADERDCGKIRSAMICSGAFQVLLRGGLSKYSFRKDRELIREGCAAGRFVIFHKVVTFIKNLNHNPIL